MKGEREDRGACVCLLGLWVKEPLLRFLIPLLLLLLFFLSPLPHLPIYNPVFLIDPSSHLFSVFSLLFLNIRLNMSLREPQLSHDRIHPQLMNFVMFFHHINISTFLPV